jgi:hypothetical protein
MVTRDQAEKMAKITVSSLVNECSCQTVEDVANVLTMLASVSGVAMIATVGKEEAIERMEAVAIFMADLKVEFKKQTMN